MTLNSKKTALVTGASSGIGRASAEALARAGFTVFGTSRKPSSESSGQISMLACDVTDEDSVASLVSTVLSSTGRIDVLVNNAGLGMFGGAEESSIAQVQSLFDVNLFGVMRMTNAVLPSMRRRGEVVGIAPEFGMTVYGATKAFVTFLSQGLSLELGPKGVYIQAVLPAATRTEIWEHSGIDVNAMTGVMEVGDLVDAALVGYDRREAVTIPPLPDAAQWDAYQAARQAMLPNTRQQHPAERYRVAG